MPAAWDVYLGLSDAERASPERIASVVPALLSHLQTGGAEPPAETRRRLLSCLLASLSQSQSQAAFSASGVLLPTLSLLKHLGRSPAGSEELARARGLSLLLAYGGLARAATAIPPPRPRAAYRASTGLGITEIDSDDDDDDNDEQPAPDEPDPLTPAESEALRCLCNTLTLHPSARELFPTVVLDDRNALQGMVRLLAVQGAGFLAGRLLFLLTSRPGELVTELTEKGDVVEALSEYSLRYIARLGSPAAVSLSSGPAPTPTDILREHLKFAYNLMLQYSRQPARPARDSSEHTPATSLAPPDHDHDDDCSELSDAHTDEPGGSGSRSSSPQPGTPVAATSTGRIKRFWAGKSKDDDTLAGSTTPPTPEQPPRRSKSPRLLAKRLKSAVTGSSKSSSPPPVPTLATPADGAPSGELSMAAASYFLPLFHPYLSLACLLPLGGHANPDPKDPSPLVRSALNALLNFPIQLEELDGYHSSWLQPVLGTSVAHPQLAPLPSRLLELLGRTCAAWFPVDVVPKDKKARQVIPAHPDDLIPKGLGESARAEEILGPLMLLLRKVSMLSEPAIAMRELLFPDDLDRSILLERRPDLTGHLVRLMSSVLLPNTAYGVGEFLYNLCARDPTVLSTTLGYGNAAGFLQNRGELIPPPSMPDRPRSNAQSAPSRPVNPITGAYDPVRAPDEPQMTDEEKVREAERLYVLFDRMAKTGVMDVENPVQKARQEGRFTETSEDDEREIARARAEEEREEREVEDELRRYKERKRAGAPSVPAA